MAVVDRARWSTEGGGSPGQVVHLGRWSTGLGGRPGEVVDRARWSTGAGGRPGEVVDRSRWSTGPGGRPKSVIRLDIDGIISTNPQFHISLNTILSNSLALYQIALYYIRPFLGNTC
jgi:hypothetical protein